MRNADIRDAFFDELYELAKNDKGILLITDDMDAFGIRRFRKDFPKQFINIGVSEQNLMDTAAGLATIGKKVYVVGICAYVTARCFEQIRFSICSMNLPVTIIGIGTGFSFSFDGPTHHGTSDIAIMRTLSEITIYNPCDMLSAIYSARFSFRDKGPSYVRLDKGIYTHLYKLTDDFSKGFKIIKKIKDTNIVSTGFMTHRAMAIIKKIPAFGLVDLFRVKPLNKNFYKEVILNSRNLISLEENNLTGGIGSALSEMITDSDASVKLKRIAVDDKQFHKFGSRDYLLSLSDLDIESILKRITWQR